MSLEQSFAGSFNQLFDTTKHNLLVLQKMLLDEQKRLAEERKELEREKEAFANLKASMEKMYQIPGDILLLNVGGDHITTSKATLTQYPGLSSSLSHQVLIASSCVVLI